MDCSHYLVPLGYIALNRGEQINALWIVVAAVCISDCIPILWAFIAKKVLKLMQLV